MVFAMKNNYVHVHYSVTTKSNICGQTGPSSSTVESQNNIPQKLSKATRFHCIKYPRVQYKLKMLVTLTMNHYRLHNNHFSGVVQVHRLLSQHCAFLLILIWNCPWESPHRPFLSSLKTPNKFHDLKIYITGASEFERLVLLVNIYSCSGLKTFLLFLYLILLTCGNA